MDWTKFFSFCTEKELEGIALLRVIECTNGCIQHAYRKSHPKALPIEETREAMRFSMSLMKEMAFTLGGETYSFSEDVEKGLREIRELYTEAFRKGNEDSMDDFFAASFACVVALGEQRIRSAAEKVRNLCSGPLPVDSVQWGEDYLLNLLEKGR